MIALGQVRRYKQRLVNRGQNQQRHCTTCGILIRLVASLADSFLVCGGPNFLCCFIGRFTPHLHCPHLVCGFVVQSANSSFHRRCPLFVCSFPVPFAWSLFHFCVFFCQTQTFICFVDRCAHPSMILTDKKLRPFVLVKKRMISAALEKGVIKC